MKTNIDELEMCVDNFNKECDLKIKNLLTLKEETKKLFNNSIKLAEMIKKQGEEVKE